jgi:hypothetical protein
MFGKTIVLLLNSEWVVEASSDHLPANLLLLSLWGCGRRFFAPSTNPQAGGVRLDAAGPTAVP